MRRFFVNAMIFHWKNLFARQLMIIVLILTPIQFALISYLLYAFKGIGNMIPHIILGTGFTTLWASVIYSSASDIERERWMGNLEFLFTAKQPFMVIILAKVLANTIMGVSSLFFSFFILVVIFRQHVEILYPFRLFTGILLTVCTFVAISLLLAYLFTLSRKVVVLINFAEFPGFLLCGFFFPITMLPNIVKPLSFLLSPSWVLEFLRSCFGVENYSYKLSMVNALALTGLYLVILVFAARIFERKIRKDGSISLV